MLELYHFEPSANSMKPMICLKEKGLDFVSYYIDLHKFEQHSPAFVAVNPNGQVPALIHDGAIITESTVINEYIEDVFPEMPLRPADPLERARMRVWSKFVDEYFCPALSMIGWHNFVRHTAKAMSKDEMDERLEHIPLKEQRDKWATIAGDSFTEAELAESRRKIGESIRRLEALLIAHEWIAGRTYSLADLNSFSMVASIPRLYPEVMNDRDTPHAIAWLARMHERPAVQAALAMSRRDPNWRERVAAA